MRIFFSILLIILFVPLFILGVLASTARFQVLDSGFWISTFSKNNVYTDLASVIKKAAEDKTVIGGGNTGDVSVLTNLITPQNIQDGVDKNLKNLLGFMNGEVRELDVYIPFDKVPKGLLPATFDEQTSTIPLSTVLASLNVRGIDNAQINMVSGVGLWSWIVFIADLALLFTVTLLLYLTIKSGARFWNIGTGLILSGVALLMIYILGEGIRRSMLTEWPKSTEAIQRILATFSPFVFQRILFLWLIIGVVAMFAGVLLFFIKKRVYNIRK